MNLKNVYNSFSPNNIFRFSKQFHRLRFNNDLKRVDWDSGLRNCIDINNAWVIFKTILLALCDKHIKKLKDSSKGQPPWMDSDIHKICMKKDHHRQKFVETGNPSHDEKYKRRRKDMKKKVKEKMRANFDDEFNPNALNKKFWSYVKSSSNTSRIPDKISYTMVSIEIIQMIKLTFSMIISVHSSLNL